MKLNGYQKWAGVFFLSLTACFNEFPDSQFPPSITVIYPNIEQIDQSERPFNVGALIPFELEIDDPDTPMQELAVTISSDIDGIIYQGTPDGEGVLSIRVGSLRAGTHNITISVSDIESYVSQSFSIGLNSLPPPPEVEINPSSPTTLDDLYADIIMFEDPENDEVDFSIEWSQSGVNSQELTSVYLDSELTKKGERWYLKVTPSDPYGDGQSTTASVIIGNSAPVIETISITPEVVYNDSPIFCSAIFSDADNDDSSVIYTWSLFLDGIEVNLGSGSEFIASSDILNPEDRLYCVASIDDGEDTVTDETVIYISNRNPDILEINVLHDSLNLGSILQCVGEATDSDNEDVELNYSWLFGDNDITGALLSAESTLTLTNLSKGEAVTCFVTATDSSGGTTTSSTSLIVDNSPPEIAALSLVPFQPEVNDTIDCLAVSQDIDLSDTISLSYLWTVNGIPVSNTLDTFSGISNDIHANDIVQCQVTPFDGTDYGEAMDIEIQIVNSTPTIGSVTLFPETFYTNTDIVAIVESEDLNGDILSLNYTWRVNGGLVQDGIFNTLDGNDFFSKNDEISVDVVASDAFGGVSYSTAPVTVQNSPPLSPTLVLDEFTLDEENVVCEISELSFDPDGDAITYTFEWEQNNHVFNTGLISTTYVNDTLSASSTFYDDQIQCTVTPNDGEPGIASAVQTTVSACEPEYAYDIEQGLMDIFNPAACFSIGKTDTLPPLVFSDFPTDSSTSEVDLLCLSQACVGHNKADSSVYFNYATWPGYAVAFHPDTNPLTYPGFSWQAPLNSTCFVDLLFTGITSYATVSTDVNVYIYHEYEPGNSVELESYFVDGYQIPAQFSQSISFNTGERLYAVVEGNSTYDWLAMSGSIQCVY